MKTSKITIRSLFGVAEQVLNGSSVEITGKKGSGKTSILDAIRYALTNSSGRNWIVKNGEKDGEIFIETDTGLSIDRKKRTDKADYIQVKDGGLNVGKPETFLREIFTPMQLNPVEFTQMTAQEQNRIILDLIDFPWDLQWIQDKFREIPQGVNYQQNILQVLNDIQADKGAYFQTRQDINRDIHNKKAFIEDIAKDIPAGYQADKWDAYDLAEKYSELNKIKDDNNKIQRAKTFKDSYDNKLRGLQADRDIAIGSEEKAIANERDGLNSTISRLKAEIKAAEDKLLTLDDKLQDKKKVIISDYDAKVTQLNADIGVADQYINKEIQPVDALQSEITEAEAMKKHLNEYSRMKSMQKELDELTTKSQALTDKIELARTLPGEILKTATIPIDGLTIEDGIPLINGLPISNRSDGELLELCVDVAISKPNQLQIILIDGAEKLDDDSRTALYEKCKAKGLQFIATRTTNDNELIVSEL